MIWTIAIVFWGIAMLGLIGAIADRLGDIAHVLRTRFPIK